MGVPVSMDSLHGHVVGGRLACVGWVAGWVLGWFERCRPFPLFPLFPFLEIKNRDEEKLLFRVLRSSFLKQAGLFSKQLDHQSPCSPVEVWTWNTTIQICHIIFLRHKIHVSVSSGLRNHYRSVAVTHSWRCGLAINTGATSS